VNNADELWRGADARATMVCHEHDTTTYARARARHGGLHGMCARLRRGHARASCGHEPGSGRELGCWAVEHPRARAGQPHRTEPLGASCAKPRVALRCPSRVGLRARRGGGVYHGEREKGERKGEDSSVSVPPGDGYTT
jgi:hypothetical protein